MTLPAPRLDDRTFQDLVDDAKRLVQQRCPEWTDHNVSDPGVTLIEAFAQMVDQLLYRLNRVPERNYVKFLDLLGVQLLPPGAARGEVTFWLSAVQPEAVRVRAETEVATPRTDLEESVVFATVDDLTIPPCTRARVASAAAGAEPVDLTADLDERGAEIESFSSRPRPGDALLVGLSDAMPSCAVVLRMSCRVRGHGVDPEWPPLQWQAWTPSGWAACELDRDETGGLNQPGDVVLHLPRDHTASVIAKHRAGWLRCLLLAPEEGQRTYSASPSVSAVSAFTIGGTVGTVHAATVRGEELGVSEGVPGQRFPVQRRPVVPSEEPLRLRVSSGEGWEEWTAVDSFSGSRPGDRHFRLDAVQGEVQLGPAVRQPDGGVRQYGAVPRRGARLVLAAYRTGGGRRGNVARGAVRVLKTSVPYVGRVENRAPAIGGVDAESLDEAKVRGPVLLRTRGRAVTAEDFEELTREAAPEVARVACLAAGDGADAGGVRVVVVPHAASDHLGRVPFEDLQPPEPLLRRISEHLDERRLVGTRVVVEPPFYQGVTVVVRARAARRTDPAEVRAAVLRALYTALHPIHGGHEGRGWPFGRPVSQGEIFGALVRLPGVEFVEDVRLFPADPVEGKRGEVTTRLVLPRHGLVHSYEHQVRVQS